MILRMMETGPLGVNCYIVGDEATGEAAIFDPGGNAEQILNVLSRDGLKLKYIINTHTHWDHVGGNQDLQKATGAPILTHRNEGPGLQKVSDRATHWGHSIETSEADRFVEQGDMIRVGSITFEVIDLRRD